MMAMMMMMMPAMCWGEHFDYNANNPHDANFNHDGADHDCNVFPFKSFGVPIDSQEGIAQRGGDPW